MILANNFNFVAGSNINAGDLLTIDTTNTTAQKLCLKPATNTSCVVAHAAGSAAAGSAVPIVRLDIGQVVVCKAAGSISAGAQLGVSSTEANYGQVVTGGALPLFAIDAASNAGDMIRVIVALTIDADTQPSG